MIQREVARRLCARPGSTDYGAFSVFTQWNCEPEVLFDVAPGCFMPPPKVTSTVIRLRRREQPPCPVRYEELLFRTVRAAFNQRRKTLVNALAPAFPDAGRPALAAAVAGAGLDVRVRGEALGIPEFAALADRLAEL